jgi:hypothetical protein
VARLKKQLVKSSEQGVPVAQQFHLYSSLREAWESGALSFRESWEIQDHLLLLQEGMFSPPEPLEPLFNKLAFFQAQPGNHLPL